MLVAAVDLIHKSVSMLSDPNVSDPNVSDPNDGEQ